MELIFTWAREKRLKLYVSSYLCRKVMLQGPHKNVWLIYLLNRVISENPNSVFYAWGSTGVGTSYDPLPTSGLFIFQSHLFIIFTADIPFSPYFCLPGVFEFLNFESVTLLESIIKKTDGCLAHHVVLFNDENNYRLV